MPVPTPPPSASEKSTVVESPTSVGKLASVEVVNPVLADEAKFASFLNSES